MRWRDVGGCGFLHENRLIKIKVGDVQFYLINDESHFNCIMGKVDMSAITTV